MKDDQQTQLPLRGHGRGLWILSPLVVFFVLYLSASILLGDFYKMPVTVAFMAACTWAFIVCRPRRFSERIERFSRGAAHSNIMMMVWIFVLAGAFAASAKYIGSVDATVNLTLSLLPANMVLAGVFLAACVISLSIGTSVGTIVALMPVAVGLADKAGADLSIMAGSVIGGAFFGDNLSFISDTTIASTRTQGCAMQDKFKANFAIVLPAALLVLVLYVCLGWHLAPVEITQETQWLKVLPYLLVLITALCGMNVMKVLILGIVATGIVAGVEGSCTTIDWVGAMGQGMTGMGELIIVTLLAAGMLELIRYNGGLAYIVEHLTSCIRGRRGAECSIALMTALANFCTANNTVAIVAVGNIARSVAQKYGISAPRSASLMDTASCVIQGILPYGAQLLMGSALAGITAFSIIPYLFYPFVMGISAAVFIIFCLAEKKSA